MSGTIRTANAIITDSYALIKSTERFFLPQTMIVNGGTSKFLRASYRRFMRLAPFVSQRAMVRSTYVDYIRYKYKIEDYDMKRRLVLGDTALPRAPLRQQILNTLNFIITAVSYTEKPKDKVQKTDIILARKILKNLLTMEYEKMKKNKVSDGKDYINFKLKFNHLTPGSQKIKPISLARNKVIKDFDSCIVYLNETVGLRL
ncbi:hypothetical protein KAFR_0L00280 [Kazachstania africana CBS 2517]|uniref:Increased recombination centers protein 19 n=1 Tax=Kazachstania africana (strain ATCC 22294 / BCRC 22015 / CBS 2517 / CECT 1963 / NBRC 1671 / NRRL Y-8276) TaxID=1071382 RepID=H2B1Y5_KAZAF|nr:hypothetical protein KAFR_0L00280 [Kazachstania africana CBS 2517]CCF60635.1 hypothetical protein KAFR_0L00280 [Kazachstania africana CBS 2517]